MPVQLPGASMLIVDDDPDSHFLFAALIKAAELAYPVRSAYERQTAVAAVRAHLEGSWPMAPLVVWLDRRLNTEDGLTVLQDLQDLRALAAGERIVVVVMSATLSESQIAEAYAAGADAVVTKYPEPKEVRCLWQIAIGPDYRPGDLRGLPFVEDGGTPNSG